MVVSAIPSLRRRVALLVCVGGVMVVVGGQQRVAPQSASTSDIPATSSTSLPTLPTDPALPRTSDGRHYPLVPQKAQEVASLLDAIESVIRDPAVPLEQLSSVAHQQQVIYRILSRDPSRIKAVRKELPHRWQWVFDQHIAARREFLAMHRRQAAVNVPAWRIHAPAPEQHLLKAYRSAARATGIPWTVLAAVNLVETGMGRIDGVSVANAQGPMQFLPTTWAEPGIGQGGDIRNPWDAIHAAGRYLVRRGGLTNIRRGLWGYNNSNHYGEAVLRYAALLDRHPLAYRGLYHWQIHYASAAGDLWLHEGYARTRPVSALQHVREFPYSKPPSTLP